MVKNSDAFIKGLIKIIPSMAENKLNNMCMKLKKTDSCIYILKEKRLTKGKTKITPNKLSKKCDTAKALDKSLDLILAIRPVKVVPMLAPRTIQMPERREINLLDAAI